MSIKIREKKLKSGKKSLYLDIYHNGKRQYEFLKDLPKLTGDRKHDKEVRQLAESIKAKRQLDLAHNSHGFTAPFKKKANFVDYFQKVGDSFNTSTKKQYYNVLKKIKSYARDQVQFGAIDKRWVEGFKNHLLKSIGENTARTYMAMLKAVLNKAVKDDIINRNPADKVDNFKKQSKLIEYLTMDELKILSETELNTLDLKEAFLFSCYTGLRYSDVEALKWDQIRGNKIEFRQKKTSDVEYLPMNKQALSILNRMDRSRPSVFELPTNAYCNQILKDWAEDAELDRWIKDKTKGQRGLTYHVSRHTFAVQLLNNGVDLYSLKELMGHTSIDSTEVYAQIVGKTKEKAINKFPEL